MYLFDHMQLELGEVKHIPYHEASGWDLFFLLKGEAKIELDGQTHHMRSEDIVLCTEGQSYGFTCGAANVLFHVHLDQDLLAQEFAVTEPVFCNTLLDQEKYDKKYFELKRLVIRLLLAYYQHDQGYLLNLHTALF